MPAAVALVTIVSLCATRAEAQTSAPAATPRPAATATPSAPPTIGNVTVVSGRSEALHRTTQAASLLDRSFFASTPALTLEAALRGLPGVDRIRSDAPFTNYGQLRLSLTGAGSDRGALFVDGVPAQDGFGGQIDGNAYPAGDIAHAEILRGPGSALYGSGAIGGVLSVGTLAPARNGDRVVTVSGGGTDRGGASFAAVGGKSVTTASAWISTQRYGFDDIPPGQISRADRPATSLADVAHVRLRHSAAHSTIDLDALHADDSQSDGRPNDGFARAVHQLASTWTGGGMIALSATAYARETDVQNIADMFPTAPGKLLYFQRVPSSDEGIRARIDAADRDGATTLLLDHRLATGESRQTSAAGLVQSDVAGTQRLDGASLQREWDGRFGATLGVRYDAIATEAVGPRAANALSPRMALREDLSPAVAVRAAFGTGLRAPFLNELIRGYRISTIQYLPNAALAPERSRSGQVGIDIVDSPTSRFAVDFTSSRVHDAIGFRTVSPTAQQRANFGETASDAWSAEYQHTIACAQVRAFTSVSHDRVVAGTPAQIGKRLAYVPDETAGITVARTINHLSGSLELSYSGPSFADDIQQQPLGSSILLGGRITARADNGTTLSVGIDNASDAHYLTSIDRLGPPSSVTLRLSLPVGRLASRRPSVVCSSS